jgi:hypothetical protein
MKIFTGLQNIQSNITLTWGKGKNSRKWRDLVQKAYGEQLGKFLRFATMKFGYVDYTFHVYENAAFMIKETSSTGGEVTHFGFGAFSGTKALRWQIKDGKWVSGQGHILEPLGSVTRVKDLFEDKPKVEDKPKSLQEQWQPTIDKIKAQAKKHNFNVTRYRLKADPYSLTLCVGRDNELFDEGEEGDDALGQYQSKFGFEIAADITGGGVQVLNW